MDNKATGSFGIPPEMQEAIRKSKNQASGEEESTQEEPKSSKKDEYTDSESIPEEFEKTDGEEAEEEEPKGPTDAEIAAKIEKDLGIELDEDDLWQLYFGILKKENIVIIPGKVHATFKTLSLDENDLLDEAMKDAVEKKLLDTGVYNIKARKTLSFCLVGMGKPSKIKSLGATSEETYENLVKKNTLMIEKFIKKWNQFLWLVNFKSMDEDLKN